MPRYKFIDPQPKLLPVDLSRQLLPGTFEHALNHLLDHAIDLSSFDARFHNEETGAPAYPPGLLLKVVLAAYAHGIVSSRGIERACQEHVTFIALCGDQAPHFTTIAHFVSTLGDDIARVFAAVVAICDVQGLIGREMFAIDGVKLPSNAAKRRSGTRADFERQAEKYEATVKQILTRHHDADTRPEPTVVAKEQKRVERLERDAAELRDWLATHPTDRRGPTGGVRQSNRTDNESAKMGTGKGVIQGYTGAAAVDAKAQIILDAQAFGTGSEQEVLLPVVDALGDRQLLKRRTLITADAGYHSEANLAALAARKVTALIADSEMRKRDERFATQARHRAKKEPLHDKSPRSKKTRRSLPLYQPEDFQYDPVARTCVCPAGNSLYRTGQAIVMRGTISERFRGTKRDCLPCRHRARCLAHPERTAVRQVAFFRKNMAASQHTQRMRAAIDTPIGRIRYAARFGTVEPVFANVCYNKGLARFTLRGRTKVQGQWRLFCLVHNIEKLARHGYAA